MTAGTAALLATALAPAQADHPDDADTTLFLVTLTGPGTSGHRGDDSRGFVVQQMRADQDRLLDAVDAPDPIYRWTTALNGFAVELDAEQARTLSGSSQVALVEKNAVRRLSTLSSAESQTSATAPAATAPGGGGTVIGFIDSGIDPNNRAFSDAAPLGGEPRFRGDCTGAAADPTWSSSACGEKVVGAQYFLAGYGADSVRSGDSLSPRDTDGHGTQIASIAAGSAKVPVRVAGHRLGKSSGAAPRARIASYKACWSAPDPAGDGCATADVVAAIDRATADRVDVLNVSVAGPNRIDTVERALLGATEAGIVTVGAAGNQGEDAYAGHPSPWVITVGATNGTTRNGVVVAGDRTFRGRMASAASVTDAPLVYAADAAAPGAKVGDARVCRPGSLDARAVADAVVVCERGETARVVKSRAVKRADGVAMVLANTSRSSINADLHALPTVHLRAGAARALARWAARGKSPRIDLTSTGLTRGPQRVTGFSSVGDPQLSILKPDLVAPGSEVLGAVPGGWDLATGTSAASARVSGLAARLLAMPGATPRAVRSALRTTARPLPGADTGEAGSGRATRRGLPPLSYLVSARDHRAWLSGRLDDVNQPHALLNSKQGRVQRTITNTGDRIIHITAGIEGFSAPVHVYPSWAELAPGDTLTFTVTLPSPRTIDSGSVIWRTPSEEAARLTVVATR